MFDRYKLEIAFAHRTFAWGSDARGMAHVHVVIIGLARREAEPKIKRLFSYHDIKGDPVETRHDFLSAYLFPAKISNKHVVVREVTKPLCDAPLMRMGSKIVDGGFYIFTDQEKAEFLKVEPAAETLFCPLIGSQEFINGDPRWILRLDNVPPQTLRSLPHVAERISAVRKYRLASAKAKTRELGDQPTRFEVTTIPEGSYLVIPETSSENREYIPLGWVLPPTIPSNAVRILTEASLWHFAVLTSGMHMAWMRQIGGRLESRYRYSVGLVYNTFPWPDITAAQQEKLATLAQAILDARAHYPDATLADLYDPDLMKPDLRKAHRTLDQAVDKLYRTAPFANDTERVEHLFGLYEKMTAPLAVSPKRKNKAKR